MSCSKYVSILPDLTIADTFKDRWKKIILPKKILKFVFEKFPLYEDGDAVYSGKRWQIFLYNVNKTKPEGDKQYAIAMVFLKDGTATFFGPFYPKFEPKISLHSEEIIINPVDNFLRKTKTMAEHIYIYSLNSPCLERGHKDPCMFQLLKKAIEWHELYNVSLCVAYTKCWGLSGPNYFKIRKANRSPSKNNSLTSPIEDEDKNTVTITTKELMSLEKYSPDLYSNISFTLNAKYLEDILHKKDVFNSLTSPFRLVDKNIARKQISLARKELVSLAKKSPQGVLEEHLDCGRKMLNSVSFLPAIQNEVFKALLNAWEEVVNYSLMTGESFTGQFNKYILYLFWKECKVDLGNNCPFKLQHIPPRKFS
ncbi:uncharacterized protein LOC117737085 [Cyclopterus lumpus]|uniref:uncharacterized protein LOC117737085 n=1 Tax=Cyclopterus lumpus TaxID=8103 RepID=UPI001485E592|nr:uncharacterized protein LOC117737085 [Cyclopterus lumpus]XP_034398624.1 uncharacterized protein LOC117737085 [Cyclopterus lumpus]